MPGGLAGEPRKGARGIALAAGAVTGLAGGSRAGGAAAPRHCAAALRILSRRSDARFQLAGFSDGGPDSIEPAELDAWIAGGVEYLGRLDDVRPAIRPSSVFVLPSYREGTPRSVLEAMAMGRPIITTDVPGCRETVVAGSNGLLVPARDAEALAFAMESLIEQPHLRAEMGDRSLALCRSKYDVNEVTTVLLQHLGLLETSASVGRPQ
jgi:glycosyltransferase involved in cell wall biosynthesis